MKNSKVNVNYNIKKARKKEANLANFEKVIYSHNMIDKKLGKQIIEFQINRFKKFSKEKLQYMGFSKSDILKLSGDLVATDLDLWLFPDWIRIFLEDYWIIYDPIYVVNFQNNSSYSHDYVVAYETDSGLIDLKQTTVSPWSTGSVHCAPCWDMLQYAWSVWNPEDNLEISRSRTYTVEEINNVESVKRACVDTWEVNIEY